MEKKNKIKKIIFPYRYIKEQDQRVASLEDYLKDNSIIINDLRKDLSERDSFISGLNDIFDYGVFNKTHVQKFRVFNKNHTFTEYKNDFIKVKKAVNAIGGSSYVASYKNLIFIITADGYLQYFDKDLLLKDSFKSINLKTNIKNLIFYKKFYENSKYGIKDLLIIDDNIYFSYIKEVKPNCVNTSIMKAEINFNHLFFEEFFSPKECIDTSQKYIEPHSSGGRLIEFNSEKKGEGGRVSVERNLLFSVGDYLDYNKAQDKKSIFGKIIQISQKKSNIYQLISIGHRNPQGLFYDSENKIVISTEHGPQGGDEVNINKLDGKLNNYGWPVSSYGEHYGYKKPIKGHEMYNIAPLYKSHSKYGFIEPLIYYTPLIAISEIIKVNSSSYDLEKEKFNILIFGSLGNLPIEGDQSIHFLKIEKNYNNVIEKNFININNRVRDVHIINEKTIIFTLESRSAIGILTIE